ncbi:MAG: DUF3606 domain-containing protein [Pyrinomonadaceae bacterium]|nr:DUF3606 domain-containing protein [Phycisphaerales bacterium]
MPDYSRENDSGGLNRINVRNVDEQRHWCEVLGVSAHQLRNAIQVVGPLAEDVERYLCFVRPDGDTEQAAP